MFGSCINDLLLYGTLQSQHTASGASDHVHLSHENTEIKVNSRSLQSLVPPKFSNKFPHVLAAMHTHVHCEIFIEFRGLMSTL